MSKYVRHWDELPHYSPPNHSGTVNTRLLGEVALPGQKMNINLGVVSQGGSAHPHAHRNSEQAVIILAGRGRQMVGGEVAEVGPGHVVHMPRGVPHALDVLSPEPLRAIIIYTPILRPGDWLLPEKHSETAGRASTGKYIRHWDDLPHYSPPNHSGTVNTRLVGEGALPGEGLVVVRGEVVKGGSAHPHVHRYTEQAVIVLGGLGRQVVGDEVVEVGPGHVVHMPPGTPHALEVFSDEPFRGLIIYAPPLRPDDWMLGGYQGPG